MHSVARTNEVPPRRERADPVDREELSGSTPHGARESDGTQAYVAGALRTNAVVDKGGMCACEASSPSAPISKALGQLAALFMRRSAGRHPGRHRAPVLSREGGSRGLRYVQLSEARRSSKPSRPKRSSAAPRDPMLDAISDHFRVALESTPAASLRSRRDPYPFVAASLLLFPRGAIEWTEDAGD